MSGSVLGIDFGNEKCVVATVSKGSVEVVADGASDRYLT
jgi:molecular chaperone DnaK (HSP70)